MRLWQECNNLEPKKCENINLESKSSSAQRVDYDDEEVENNEQNSPWELSTACLLWLSGSTRWLNSSIAPHLLDDEDVDDGDDDEEDVDYQDDKDESSPKSGESFCYLTAAQYLARSCLCWWTWLDDTNLAEKNVLQKQELQLG